MKINNITKTETYIQLDCEDNVQYLMPASATIFIDESDSISVKTIGSRKTVGYQPK